ncbi:voltage-gated chloride channel family protein [Paenibacillus alginolyticus]|uniref:Voltage-gated chloride channel family protein n=1 Tax=Paenibacillus alginolyticus TaxID=59839 RepID=A0ABT4G7W3_9BACL|nr:voltage-gated chloride channel family protein [Paenibacillus alginolyticus]MCY9692262.1 voltage-gated chloride channel family protein [Paenibacillus alginolyticus]MEC0145896.1 voltage-gated chloride channel family protein [Paenibacillus alginolyticus]
METFKMRWIGYSGKFVHVALLGTFLKWIMLGSAIGILTGTASALFLTGLDYVTNLRMQHPWLLLLLPLGGAVVSYLYLKFGKNSSKGNNLILEQINDGKETIPLRMAPLVLFGTLITHLFGGSAGREGTAVQMGGSLSEWFGKLIRVNPVDRKILLICGISGGFGSIFGTPLAGTVFGLEVLAIGIIRHEALIPAFVASLVGNVVTTSFWGVSRIHYQVGEIPALTFIVVIKVVFASILFGLTSIVFSELTHLLKKWYSQIFKNPMIKSAVGGIIIIGLVYLLGTRDYLGLGVPLIQDSFKEDVSPFAFLWKLIFTSLTLGAGFQGGEVTPLFAIGATLGNALAGFLHLYAPFLAALGFIAVFCGATNTPIACFLMGIELFGSNGAIYMFIACIVSYLFAGHTGIYPSQQIGVSKYILSFPKGSTLASIRTQKKKKFSRQKERD